MLIPLANHVAVMSDGEIVYKRPIDECDQQEIGRAMADDLRVHAEAPRPAGAIPLR